MNEPKKIISHSQLPSFMDKVFEEIKKIPEDHVQSLHVISLLLDITSQYAIWTTDLKKEILNLDRLNKSQAEAIRNRQKIVV